MRPMHTYTETKSEFAVSRDSPVTISLFLVSLLRSRRSASSSPITFHASSSNRMACSAAQAAQAAGDRVHRTSQSTLNHNHNQNRPRSIAPPCSTFLRWATTQSQRPTYHIIRGRWRHVGTRASAGAGTGGRRGAAGQHTSWVLTLLLRGVAYTEEHKTHKAASHRAPISKGHSMCAAVTATSLHASIHG
jgi:hypothetical protein